MLEKLNHLAWKALDTLEEALNEPGIVGVNAAKAVLHWQNVIMKRDDVLIRLAELERQIKERLENKT